MPKSVTKLEEYEKKQLYLSEERTLLSKERTILSFMQVGLAFVTVGIVIANYFISQTSAQVVGYTLVGIGFIEVFESIRRLLVKQREMNKLRKDCGLST
jgi:uncharacterized membrane protein YidH (DUF202 family)